MDKIRQRPFKSNNNIVFDCKYHIIWCVKYRKQLITGKLEERLKEICKEVAQKRNSNIIEIECDKDHIHLLVEADPQYGIHKLIKEMKGLSSRLLRQEFEVAKTRVPTLWTNSYFVSTVGSVSLETVKNILKIKKQHTNKKRN